MDDSVFKTKYQKYKYKVKLWETQFKEKSGRIPSKHDIREAPSNIRDSYKMYYKLKSSFLEETLSDALEDDAFDLSLLESSSQLDSPLCTSLTPDVTQLTSLNSTILNNHSLTISSSAETSTILTRENVLIANTASSYDTCVTEFDAEKLDSFNENAWGKELNQTTGLSNEHTEANKPNDAGNSLRKTMSDKLFRNSSFTKRNPRKSLSRSSLTASQQSFGATSSSQRETLPDLETILSQKSMKDNEANASQESAEHAVPNIGGNTNSNLINSIDYEWLNRCNQNNNLNASDGDTEPIASQSMPTKHVNPTYGLSNINANVLQTLEATPLSVQAKSDSNLTVEKKSVANDNDDDEIANSEDETVNNDAVRIRSIRHSLNKRKHSEIDNSTLTANGKSSKANGETATAKIHNKSIADRKVLKGKRIAKKAVAPVMPSTVNLRSSRTRTARKHYAETQVADDSDRADGDDPFAGDDSDADPDFTDGIKKTDSKSDSGDETPTSETNDAIVVTKNTKREKEPKKTVVNVVRKRATKQPSIKPDQVRKVRRVVATRKKVSATTTGDEASSEMIVEEKPDDYFMEFGIDSAKIVPRFDIGELTKTTQRFTEYVHSSSALQVANPTTAKKKVNAAKPLSSKNSVAKEKLQKRIAAGTLNENFVSINLQKKVFVRGKKTINFSRYKKQQWRNKKVAALTGPDMDMGGCDGGILVCFQCGQPGHFAQNCNVKSDRLLPLSADVEESPFLTLQEVEEISKQKIVSAHAGREVPEVDNPTWKTANDGNGTNALDALPQPIEISDSDFSATIDVAANEPAPVDIYIGHQIPEDFLKKAGLLHDDGEREREVRPIYKLNADGSLPETPNEVFEALRMFGHDEFRNGQEKAVMRILSGQSTLVTLSTGSGKSLCYQLPAFMYSKKMKCITLVISPLVSLMEDQVHGVPDFLNAQCLHTNQKKEKRDLIMEQIKAGDVHVLLVSPEAIVAGEKSTGFGSILRDLPPIAFVCIDEAHCVSQWSHNFRPSYLMVCRVLQEKLKVKTVLGLTATATLSTRQSIVRHLMVPDGLTGVISDIPLPDNLLLTISNDENRDAALVRLLRTDRFAEFKSIIIYCSRRDECDRIAKHLRTHFQESIASEMQQMKAVGKRKRTTKTTIEAYHAGLGASSRRAIQNRFMSGKSKIVVATIAFGMGINKADIRAVIHYNMPMNFESYVQEVGRAGRDGQPAHCHLFLDPKGVDKLELRRHIYANSIDRRVIRKLLCKIFVPCACKRPNDKENENGDTVVQSDLEAVQNISWEEQFDDIGKAVKQRNCPGHEVCFSVDETISELDIPEENIATLLCYLELHEQRYIKTLSKAYTKCKVFSYGGSKALRTAAANCPPLAMAIALDLNKGISHETSTFIEFPVIDIASAIGWNSGVVKYQLKNLEWTNVDGVPIRSKITVEFFDLGFRVAAPGDLNDFELDSTLDLLYSRVQEQECNQLSQLDNVFRGLTSVASASCVISAKAEYNDERSEKLKIIIRNYFQSNEKIAKHSAADEQMSNEHASSDAHIISDVRTMISLYPENDFTGRALARIFHGVSSPVYPAVIWGRCKYWRAHIKTDFNHIVKLSNMEILKIRM